MNYMIKGLSCQYDQCPRPFSIYPEVAGLDPAGIICKTYLLQEDENVYSLNCFLTIMNQLWAREVGEAIPITTQNRDRDF